MYHVGPDQAEIVLSRGYVRTPSAFNICLLMRSFNSNIADDDDANKFVRRVREPKIVFKLFHKKDDGPW